LRSSQRPLRVFSISDDIPLLVPSGEFQGAITAAFASATGFWTMKTCHRPKVRVDRAPRLVRSSCSHRSRRRSRKLLARRSPCDRGVFPPLKYCCATSLLAASGSSPLCAWLAVDGACSRLASAARADVGAADTRSRRIHLRNHSITIATN
jgi:hypothetical protein